MGSTAGAEAPASADEDERPGARLGLQCEAGFAVASFYLFLEGAENQRPPQGLLAA